LGNVAIHEIGGSIADGKLYMSVMWSKETTAVKKVNALLATGDSIVIGGLSGSGGGVIEVWEKESSSSELA